MAKANSEQLLELGTPVPGFDNELGTRLKWVIDKIGTQKKAGEVAGVKPEMIGKYIAGKAKPSFYAIKVLGEAANVSLDWIAYGGDENGVATEDGLHEEALRTAIEMVEADLASKDGWANEKQKAFLIATVYKALMLPK